MSNKEKILGLRTCAYIVADLKAATKWYGELFGTQPYFNESFYVGFNIGGYELGLMPGEHKINKADNVLSYWGVEDITAVYGKALKMGGEVHEEPHNVGGELMVSSVFDPWGNLIGFIYNPYFEIKD